MSTFMWNENFMTGISSVDTQHQALVDIINNISECVLNNKKSDLKLSNLLKELMEYTKYHFDEEEELAQKSNVDNRHNEKHKKEHAKFVERVVFLASDISEEKVTEINFLLDFLINWLAYHILVTDKNLARQIAAIESGANPQEAYDIEEKKSDDSLEPLLNALDKLINQVSQKNEELLYMNKTLELKVKERTRELEKVNDKLEKLSLTDELTSLANRRLCMQVLNRFWNDSDSISCIMLDADNFKGVNDTYGHDMGDKVLQRLAKTFTGAVRTDDIVCRLGGDEFLIICLNTDLDGAIILAEEIHAQVNKLKVPTGSGYWHGSVSIGVASKTINMRVSEDLMKVADNGVYAAKNAGKNCIKSA